MDMHYCHKLKSAAYINGKYWSVRVVIVKMIKIQTLLGSQEMPMEVSVLVKYLYEYFVT